MKRGRLWLALAAFIGLPASARAEPSRAKAEIALESHAGQSTAPYFTRAFPSTSGYGASVVLDARMSVSPRLVVGARVPFTFMRVEQPAGALYAEAAWANPELGVTLDQPWFERQAWRMHFATGVAVGAPLAEHDAAQLAGRALRLANAFEGFSEPALYTPGVISVSPSGSLTAEQAAWKLSAAVRIPLLIRTSDADLPPEARARAFGLVPVLGLELQRRLLRWLSLAAAPRLTVLTLAPVHEEGPPVQFLAGGHADARLGEHFTLSALFQAPLGRPLGGSTLAGGLRLSAVF